MRRSRLASAGLAGMIGAIAFAASFGWATLDPTRIDWIFIGGVDPSMQFVGWHMYRNDPWTFPLGAIRFYGYPVGTSVALTDSVPIFALFFKPLAAVLPTHFQYFGLWLLLCFVLQGVFGALLVRTVSNNVVVQTLGGTLFVLSPLLVHRATHAALTAHWLLLASLWLYLKPANSPKSRLARWLSIAAIAAATHAYLTAMVLAIAAASLLRDGLHDRARLIQRTVIPSVAIAVTTLLVWWIAGYFVVSERSDFDVFGFGIASMNALAPLMPFGSALFGPGPFVLADPAQNEGYAYLGAGTWFLLVLTLVTIRPRRVWVWLRAGIRAHAALLLVFAVLIALALSPRVTVGARTVVEYDPTLWGPLTVFRASGRMFWPVYYALTFAAIAVSTRRVRHSYAVALVLAAVLLQAVDNAGVYRGSREGHARRMQGMPFSDPFWSVAAPHYRHFVLHPTNMCAPRQDQAIDYRFLALRAGVARATINAGYAARHDVEKLREYCSAFAADIKAGRVADDELWVMFPRYAPALMAASPKPLVCTLIDAHAVCFSQASYFRWQEQYDVVRSGFIPEEELRDFRQTLEGDYRDRMRRSGTPAWGSIDDRLRGLVGYLAYRSRGCGHDEAMEKALGEFRDENPVRICSRHSFLPAGLPPRNEAMAFRRALDSTLQATRPGVEQATYVDAEGETVWVQDYAEERLRGRSHRDATEAVLARIRAIAP